MSKSSEQPSARSIGCVMIPFSLVVMSLGSLLTNMMLVEPLRRGKEARAWPEVPCVVQKVGVERHQIKRSRSRRNSMAYSPDVVFAYTVDGKEYSSTTFWFSNRLLNTDEEVRELIAPYHEGGESRCWVNPHNPRDAVLNREEPGISIFGGLFGGVIALLGLAGALGSGWLVIRNPRGRS